MRIACVIEVPMPREPEPVPSTPASDAGPAAALSRGFFLQSAATHAVRILGIAALVVVVGAGASIYFSVVGWRECRRESGATVCREVHIYPFSVQVRSDSSTKNGVAHGPRYEWHANGTPWFAGSYEDGLRVGTWTEWYDNGSPRFTGHYVSDQLHGFEAWWYENGQREWEVQRRMGKRVGAESWWYENGVLRREGRYNLRGEKDGPFTVYDEDGRARFSGSYADGVLQAGRDGEAEGGDDAEEGSDDEDDPAG